MKKTFTFFSFMKKIISVILFGTMMIGMTACNHAEPKDTLEYTSSLSTAETTANRSESTGSETDIADAKEPTLYVTEELDKEKKAIKITLTGDGRYYFPNLSGEFVENYQYELGYNSKGNYQDYPLPMEGPVVAYLPLSYYLEKANGKKPLIICKVAENGSTYDTEYIFSLEIESFYSDESITLKNDFLDAAIRRYFDGEFSERDLLSIERLDIYYYNPIWESRDKNPNSIHIQKRGSGEQTVYYYSDFFDMPTADTPSVIPAELIEDLEFFDALDYLTLADKSTGETKELYKKIMENVIKEYRVTENTWDQK